MCYGFSTSAISWILRYLSNRTQRVFLIGSFSNVNHNKCGVMQGSSLGPLLLKKQYMPLALIKICVYVCWWFNPTRQQPQLVKSLQLQLVLEWVASNKLVLNISATKSIVFCTNHSLSSRPQLNLIMDTVAVEQVEETKLLGVTLDCKLSLSKRGVGSVRGKEMLCFFDTTLHKASSAGSCFILSWLLLCHIK